MRVRALQKCYVDHTLRHPGEVFHYYGPMNHEVLVEVPEETPVGLAPPDRTRPLMPHERVPAPRNENALGADPHHPGARVVGLPPPPPPPQPDDPAADVAPEQPAAAAPAAAAPAPAAAAKPDPSKPPTVLPPKGTPVNQK